MALKVSYDMRILLKKTKCKIQTKVKTQNRKINLSKNSQVLAQLWKKIKQKLFSFEKNEWQNLYRNFYSFS